MDDTMAIQECHGAEHGMRVASVDDDAGRSIKGGLHAAESEQVDERRGLISVWRPSVSQKIDHVQPLRRCFQARGVWRNLMYSTGAGVPTAWAPIEDMFDRQPQGDFSWAENHFAAKGQIFRTLGSIDVNGTSRKMDFAHAVDVGEIVVAYADLAPDIHTRCRGEFRQTTKRHPADTGAIEQPQTNWRRLSGG
jgi:hypothetical protein